MASDRQRVVIQSPPQDESWGCAYHLKDTKPQLLAASGQLKCIRLQVQHDACERSGSSGGYSSDVSNTFWYSMLTELVSVILRHHHHHCIIRAAELVRAAVLSVRHRLHHPLYVRAVTPVTACGATQAVIRHHASWARLCALPACLTASCGGTTDRFSDSVVTIVGGLYGTGWEGPMAVLAGLLTGTPDCCQHSPRSIGGCLGCERGIWIKPACLPGSTP